jgi:Uncharacterized conserved protein
MRGYVAVVLGAALLASFIFPVMATCEENKWTNLIEEAGWVLGDIQQMPDQGIPEDLMRSCQAIAIFPNTVSGGFIIGGKYGQGIIMARDQKTGDWSPPAVFTLAGGSFGWQIGGQATDFVLLIMSKRGVDGILGGKFKLGADAAVAAGPVGRAAEASIDLHLKSGILSYSRSRGLFAGAKLEGAVITEHWEADETIYGKSLSAKQILLKNAARMPKAADSVLKVLNKYSPKK